MGTGSDSDSNGWGRARGLVVKAAFLIGGAILLKRLTKSTTRWDHARIVADSLSGEKFTREQASRDPDNFFNIRMLTCPAAEMVDGSKVLYFEQAFWRTPQKPFRQRIYMVKPCPKELKCDVEVSSYAIREVEEYKNFCDRPKDQRPLPDEVIGVRLLIMLNVYVSLSKYVVGTGVLIYVAQHRTLRTVSIMNSLHSLGLVIAFGNLSFQK
ncbi:hypothetical protein Dsin_030565 [Dipteronia sinensis]|uniref:Chromophore lyase CRL, chloroplastic n=1 Tax=Dipteronia sinensis TaxID=43782 RepID=A0AAD9ZL62_9ROSI|nr:hypothetical protein Dsin_030565 [Dipteronia sinensis]